MPTVTRCKTNNEIIKFCELISATPDFANSYKQIYTFRNDTPLPVAFFNQKDTAKTQEILESRYFNDSMNYYVTKNSFYGNKRRNEYIFSYDNIVIDCDCHVIDEWGYNIDHQIGALLYLLDNDYEGKFPECNAVRTGRGVQLWIGLESFSGKLGWLYNLLCRYFCNILQTILVENGLFYLTVDMAASTNPCGLVRLPYTINQHRKSFVTELEHRTNTRYSTQELMREFPIPNTDTSTPKENKATQKPENNPEYLPLNKKRTQFIEKIVSEKNGDCTGKRDIMLFLWYNSAVQIMDRQTAYNKMSSLNQKFKEPIPQREINSITQYIDKKGYLRFKTKTFLDWLDIAPIDRVKYSMYSSRDMERQIAKKKKQERNDKIFELRKSGYTIRKIAQELKISKNTVSSVLAKGQETAQELPHGLSTSVVAGERLGNEAGNEAGNESIVAGERLGNEAGNESIVAEERLGQIKNILRRKLGQVT